MIVTINIYRAAGLFCALGLGWCVAGERTALGQVVLYNTRSDSAMQYVEVDAMAVDSFNSLLDDPAAKNDADATLAFESISASVPGAYATSMAEASNPTAYGATESVPQVDVTASVECDHGFLLASTWDAEAYATGTYTVIADPSNPTLTSGTLYADMYVVVNGGESPSNLAMLLNSSNSITATSSGSTVTFSADNTNGGWNAMGLVKSITPPDAMISYFVPGGSLNEYIQGTQTAAVGSSHSISASFDVTGGTAAATPASQIRGFSATASYSIQ